MINRTFYLVWRVGTDKKVGNSTPTKAHQSLFEATTEAHRLASENPGQEFAVMQSIASYKGVVKLESSAHGGRVYGFGEQ